MSIKLKIMKQQTVEHIVLNRKLTFLYLNDTLFNVFTIQTIKLNVYSSSLSFVKVFHTYQARLITPNFGSLRWQFTFPLRK